MNIGSRSRGFLVVASVVLAGGGTPRASTLQEDPIDALFEQLVAAKPADRKVLVQRLVRLGKRAVPSLVRVLAKESTDGEDESFDDVVGLGGGAGGWFKRPEYSYPLLRYRSFGKLVQTRPYYDRWRFSGITNEKTLAKKNWGKFFLAAYVLGEIGADAKPAIPELNKWLDQEYERQHQAFWALGRIGKASLPIITKHIQKRLGRAAVALVGSDATSTVVAALTDAKTTKARTAWCHTVGHFDVEHGPALVPAVIAGLGSALGNEATTRMRVLWVHHKAARAELEKTLEAPDARARLRALAVLARSEPDARVHELAMRRAQQDGDVAVRRYAFEFLLEEAQRRRLAALAPRVLEGLEAAHARASESMLERMVILELYAVLRAPSAGLAKFAEQSFGAKFWQERVAAHGALGQRDVAAAAAIAKSLAKESQLDAKIAKLKAIARIQLRGPVARELCRLLLAQYHDEGLRGGERSAFVAGFVLDALRSLGPDAAPALDRVMTVLEKSSVPWLRREAIRVLGSIGPSAAERAVPALEARLARGAKYPVVTVEALGKLGARGRLLAKYRGELAAAEGEDLVRLAEYLAVLELSAADAKKIGSRLRERVADIKENALRARLFEALGFDRSSAHFLIERYRSERYWRVEQGLLKAFARLGPAAKAVAPEISKRIAANPRDWMTSRRRAALDAIHKSR